MSVREGASRPPTITMAVWLMWAGAVQSIVWVIVELLVGRLSENSIADWMRAADPDVSHAQIDDVHSPVLFAFVGAFGIIAASLWAWMAWKNMRGRAWARSVATGMAVINVVSLLSGFATPDVTLASVILGIISMILSVVVVVLLWRPASSAYYVAASVSPQQ